MQNLNNDFINLCKIGNVQLVKLLLKHGADVHADDNYALRWASEKGHTNVVKLLLKHGAYVNARDNFALRWASNNGHTEVVKLLQQYGDN